MYSALSAYLIFIMHCLSRYRMISLADASGQRTALVALRNCLYLVPLGYLAYDCELHSTKECLSFFHSFIHFWVNIYVQDFIRYQLL